MPVSSLNKFKNSRYSFGICFKSGSHASDACPDSFPWEVAQASPGSCKGVSSILPLCVRGHLWVHLSNDSVFRSQSICGLWCRTHGTPRMTSCRPIDTTSKVMNSRCPPGISIANSFVSTSTIPPLLSMASPLTTNSS